MLKCLKRCSPYRTCRNGQLGPAENKLAFFCGAPRIGHTLYPGDSPDLAAEFVCWGCYKVIMATFWPHQGYYSGQNLGFSRVPSVLHKDNILFR
jgi:hypothetical protein